jgi:hypothetical protein
MKIEQFEKIDWASDEFWRRAYNYLTESFPSAFIGHSCVPLTNLATSKVIKPVHLFVANVPDMAIQQRMFAIPALGDLLELQAILRSLPGHFDNMLKVNIGFEDPVTGYKIEADQYSVPNKIIAYTDLLHGERNEILRVLREMPGGLAQLVDETQQHDSAFISYGGEDEAVAARINDGLKSHGISTWFFKDDASPGQKLHRVMSEGTTAYGRVLLICSESSLNRPGLLNELERVLEREAREGGSDILIPITIDDYVFARWEPQRSDLANQVRSRVIGNFAKAMDSATEFTIQLNKVLNALKN